MNRQQFSELVRNPGSLGTGTITELESMLRLYPYCMTAQILLAMNLHGQNHSAYPRQLKKAVAYAGDRKKLKELLEGKQQQAGLLITEHVAVSSPESEIPVQVIATQEEIKQENFIEESVISPEELALATPQSAYGTEEIEGFMASPPLPGRTKEVPKGKVTQDDLLAIVRKRLSEINEEKSGKEPVTESKPVSEEEIKTGTDTRLQADTNKSKVELIERFIREEPQISRPKKEFFNPASSSHRSNTDEEDIVSETLALLYAQQGNMQKAIHIYEKLSLRFSEKSRYFAAQIENLKGKQQQ